MKNTNFELTTVETKNSDETNFSIPKPPKDLELNKPTQMSYAEYKNKFLK